jgi:hypothetical protein
MFMFMSTVLLLEIVGRLMVVRRVVFALVVKERSKIYYRTTNMIWIFFQESFIMVMIGIYRTQNKKEKGNVAIVIQ